LPLLFQLQLLPLPSAALAPPTAYNYSTVLSVAVPVLVVLAVPATVRTAPVSVPAIARIASAPAMPSIYLAYAALLNPAVLPAPQAVVVLRVSLLLSVNCAPVPVLLFPCAWLNLRPVYSPYPAA